MTTMMNQDDDGMDSNSDNDHDHDHDDDVITTTVSAPSLYSRPCFFHHQTRHNNNNNTGGGGGGGSGKIKLKVVEQYLRDDVGFGSYFWDPHSTKRRKGAEHTIGKPKTIATFHDLVDTILFPLSTTISGSTSTTDSTTSSSTITTAQLLVVDTNVLLHNFDVLQQALRACSIISDDNTANVNLCMVLPQTALEECRAKHSTLYDQAVELLRSVGGSYSSSSNDGGGGGKGTVVSEKLHRPQRHIFFADKHHVDTQVAISTTTSPSQSTLLPSVNDMNDARIRKVALYFGKHLQMYNNNHHDNHHQNQNVRVIFLTDDKQSRACAVQEQQQEQQRSAIEDLCQHTVLADAWEMTALNDLKALPWEEMVVTAERHLAAYQAYKQQTSAMASIFSLH